MSYKGGIVAAIFLIAGVALLWQQFAIACTVIVFLLCLVYVLLDICDSGGSTSRYSDEGSGHKEHKN